MVNPKTKRIRKSKKVKPISLGVVYYLAFQDGPAEPEITYPSWAAANTALKAYPESLRQTTCIMTRKKT